MPCTMNPDATLNELTGEFQGLDRFVARKKIVKRPGRSLIVLKRLK